MKTLSVSQRPPTYQPVHRQYFGHKEPTPIPTTQALQTQYNDLISWLNEPVKIGDRTRGEWLQSFNRRANIYAVGKSIGWALALPFAPLAMLTGDMPPPKETARRIHHVRSFDMFDAYTDFRSNDFQNMVCQFFEKKLLDRVSFKCAPDRFESKTFLTPLGRAACKDSRRARKRRPLDTTPLPLLTKPASSSMVKPDHPPAPITLSQIDQAQAKEALFQWLSTPDTEIHINDLTCNSRGNDHYRKMTPGDGLILLTELIHQKKWTQPVKGTLGSLLLLPYCLLVDLFNDRAGLTHETGQYFKKSWTLKGFPKSWLYGRLKKQLDECAGNCSKSSYVIHQIETYVQKGLLSTTGKDEETLYFFTPLGKEMLAQYQQKLKDSRPSFATRSLP